jgi:hypothetical protein
VVGFVVQIDTPNTQGTTDMTLDYERMPDGTVEFFGCEDGNRLFYIPSIIAFMTRPIWHVLRRLVR